MRATAEPHQDAALTYLLDRPQLALDELRAEAVRRAYRKHYADVPWAMWLIDCLPKSFLDRQQFIPFASYHQEFWEWVFSIPKEEAPKPFIAVWSRDTGKSSAAEAACMYLGAMGLRKYVLYTSSAQQQADDHVGNVAALLESPEIRKRYPDLATRSLNKYGQSKGWRVNRLRTKSGFTIDAIGLDRAVRGARLEEQRPDALVLDDLDSEQDTPRIVERKLQLLTRSLLPAGDRRRLAVLYVQNIPHDDAIMARLLDKRTDLLSDAIISGPHPALLGMRYETKDGRVVITEGTPTWQGFTLAHCQNWVQRYTLRAFLAECQHERGRRTGAQWKVEELDEHRVAKAPEFRRVVVAVDPAMSSSSRGSETGVVVVGEEPQSKGRPHYYAVADHSGHYAVDEWATTAIDLWAYHQADAVVAEANQGGELVADALQQREPNIRVEIVKATRGKFTRAEPVAGLSQEGRLHMVGHLQELEQQLCTPYDPKSTESTFDRMDALVWGVTFLALIRDPYPHYRRNVVGYAAQEREPRPVAPTIALSRLDAWKTAIARGELATCDPEEYSVLRAMLMAAVEKYSQSRDVRAHIADEQLRHLDQRFGRRGKA